MKARWVWTAVAVAAGMAGAARGQVRPAGGGSMEGVVRLEGSDRPLARVRVTVKKLDAKLPVMAVTDENGRFSFTDLTPGVYSFAAEREGFLRTTTVYDGATASQSVTLWRVGQKVGGLAARLRPGAVISGRVRYRDGDAAIGMMVQVYVLTHLRGKRSYLPVGSSATNDLGEYRIHSLSPGTYYIVALAGGGAVPVEEDGARAIPTFYLSGGQLNQATPIRVGAGDVVGGCDIVLAEMRTFRVSGYVRSGLTNAPIRSPGVTLRWLDVASAPAMAAVRMETGVGEFRAAGVPPGNYLLLVDGGEDGKKLLARQVVTVTDGAVAGLEISVGPVRKWRGSIRFDARTDYDISAVRVVLEPRSDLSGQVVADVKKDGGFEVELNPEETYDVFVENTPADSYLLSATVDGGEVLGTGFTVSRTQDQRQMNLVLAARGGSVSGLVKRPDGSAGAAVLVVLLPQPAAGHLQAVGASFSDENGAFLLRGVPPGQYLAVAWPTDTSCSPYDPSPASECTAGGQPVGVDTGDVSGVRIMGPR